MLLVLELDLPSLSAFDALVATVLDVTFFAIVHITRPLRGFNNLRYKRQKMYQFPVLLNFRQKSAIIAASTAIY